MKHSILFYGILGLVLSSCGGDYKSPVDVSKESSNSFGGKQLSVVSGNLTIGQSIEGSGSLLFAEELASFDSGKSYALDFALEEGGCLDLVSHSNEGLQSGWEIQFCRQGSGVGSLKATVFANGERRDTKKNETVEAFEGFDASQPMKFQIDVHNNESPTHTLVWSRLLPIDFTENAAIFNTEEYDNSPGNGSGKRWGLRLSKARVTYVESSEPKFRE